MTVAGTVSIKETISIKNDEKMIFLLFVRAVLNAKSKACQVVPLLLVSVEKKIIELT